MKKITILSLLVIGAIGISQKANAQTDVTGPVTVNIDLTAEVISIDLGADPTVNFVYATAADYTESKTVTKEGHFTVISNLPYDITVAAQGEFVSPSEDDLPLDLVTVSVDPATANGGTLTDAPLALAETPLVGEAEASTSAVYNVDYTIDNPAPLLDLAREVYTTTVTYTATQL